MRMPPLQSFMPPARAPDPTGRRNMLLLTQLRWLAIAGQLAAILGAWLELGVELPIVPMITILLALATLNVATLVVLDRGRPVANRHLFAAFLMDWAALTAQLYLSGGAVNPFASIGLLQVVLGAVLLEEWSSWTLVTVHTVAFGLLAVFHRPLDLPPAYASALSGAHILASWLNFLLVAVLLVLFMTRIGRNLRARDARLAELRQHAAEEDHIVRMGLLASGAAHELGTPLASLSVILGDLRKQPAVTGDAALTDDIEEMRAAVARCKDIVSGILYASGEAHSEAMERIPLRRFVERVANDWSSLRPGFLTIDDRLDRDVVIAADQTLAQVIGNLLENAVEAGATRIVLRAEIVKEVLHLVAQDDGPGFPADMLPHIGEPYRSTRSRRGAGLGLFLAVNVMRKLGGGVTASNARHGGAVVTLSLPLDALLVVSAADG